MGKANLNKLKSHSSWSYRIEKISPILQRIIIKLFQNIFKYKILFWQNLPILSKNIVAYNKNFYYLPNLKKLNLQPNLILLGAQKSGTTTISNQLGKHRCIHTSFPQKEPGYYLPNEIAYSILRYRNHEFSDQNDLMRRYMALGYSGQQYFLDASTYYTLGNNVKDYNIPGRIKLACKNPKFIYILRDPIKRILSNFYHDKMNNRFAHLELNEYLKEVKYPILTSQYFYQIEPYLKVFNQKDFMIYSFEDYVKNAQNLFSGIANFLEIEPFDINALSKSKHENISKKDSYNITLDLEVIDELKLIFRKERQLLETYFDIDLSHWEI